MHTIHHTRAVILKSQPSKEADKLFWLFTEDFGLVRAVATGIRKSGAKLVSQLVDYSIVDVDLVRGRDVWRLVSATAVHDPLHGRYDAPLARPYVRTLAALDRFLIDEGEHSELFGHITEIAHAVAHPIDPKTFDTLAIWRTLVHLGYIPRGEEALFLSPFVQASALLTPLDTKRLIISVNNTIKETHL